MGNLEYHVPYTRRQRMNDQKKLTLSKETLRCLDEEDLTDVVGGGHKKHGGTSGNCVSFGCSNDGACGSYECYSFGSCVSGACVLE
jgi:natural product precursor